MHCGVCEMDVLIQVAERVALGNVDGAAVEVFFAENHFEQRGFSAAVPADDADAFSGYDDETCVLKENLGPEFFANVLYLNHARKYRNVGRGL